MERLDINSAPERANIEASIHFARYSVAVPFVKGKRVLDIACGEGYGSYLLKQAGAAEVVGVDVSPEVVNRAIQSFGASGLDFVTADASVIEEKLLAESFDVVVSCETIEHLKDPAAYLQSLKKLAKKDAVIIISCPNDYWYFPEEHQNNPYHLRKYKIEEFQQLAVSVLGDEVRWSVGTAVFGFGSTSLNVEQDYNRIPDSWMRFSPVQGAYLVSGDDTQEINSAKSSYYFGIWNAPEVTNGVAVFPVDMDVYAKIVRCMDGAMADESAKKELALLSDSLSIVKENNEEQRAELRRVGLHYQVTLAENRLLKERIHIINTKLNDVQAECDQIRVGYDRYIRLGSFVPKPIRALLKKIYKSVRRRAS